jgi:hypothetical protein
VKFRFIKPRLEFYQVYMSPAKTGGSLPGLDEPGQDWRGPAKFRLIKPRLEEFYQVYMSPAKTG